MNAVNLIPLERRRADAPGLPGVPFCGLVVTLLLALAGTFSYINARERVSTRQSSLAHVQAVSAQWSAAAARYTPAVNGLTHRANGFVQLGTLLGERADWSLLLGQLAGVMPAHAQLTSLSANATAASASTAPASTGSGITISGCALSQPVVADTMVALRRLSGVSSVSLSSAARQTTSAGAASSACQLPVQFSLSLQFDPTVALLKFLDGVGASAAGASTPAQTASTPAQTTSTPAPTASVS